jgi:molybdate transport repressor ModE-like protein
MENVNSLRLRLLLEIQRTGSISAAAETCRIGQPSASMHVRTLEAALGQRLVSRTGRGSSLTAAGKIVASHAAGVLATLESMRRALDALDARHGGELIVAASLAPSVALIPRILRAFSECYPGVNVTLRTVSSQAVLREVGRAEADIGIAGEVPTAEQVIRNEILIDELMGIASPGLLALNGGWVSLAELARNSLLVGPQGSSTRLVSERYLARAGYRPERSWVFDSYEAIKCAVASGAGISFISPMLVHKEIERGELITFRVSGIEPMTRPIQIVQPTFRDLTPQAATFITLLTDAAWAATERAPVNGSLSQASVSG